MLPQAKAGLGAKSSHNYLQPMLLKLRDQHRIDRIVADDHMHSR
jgi:hypothetical protein